MKLNKFIIEAKIQVDMDNYDKLAPKLKGDDIVSVVDEAEGETNVTYTGPMKGEEPFDFDGAKYIYVWGDYNGKKDIAVLSLKDDKIYSKEWLDSKKKEK